MFQEMEAGGYATELWHAETERAGRHSRILRDVWDELNSEAIVDPEGLEVEVDGGVVVLRGAAKSYLSKLAVLAAARRVPGVTQVVDEITVELPPESRWRDAALARAARQILAWHAVVPHGAIKVSATDGWLDLSGRVERDAERIVAEEAVRALAGVRGVRNRITRVLSTPSRELCEQVEAAVHSRLGREGKHVKATIRRDQVVLHGRVRSLAWWLAAERAATAVPNAPPVENELEIEG